MGLFETGMTPRESFERFPAWTQPLITFVSGRPARGERPLLNVAPWGAIGIDLAKIALGVAGGWYAATVAPHHWWLFGLAWLLVVNGARSLTSDAHYAAHGCVTGRMKVDAWIGEALSTLVMTVNMRDYTRGHVVDHHGRIGIGTIDDPDIGLMQVTGFETGRSARWYWWRLVLSLVSPRYHLIYLWVRLKSNFVSARPARLAMSYALHGAILAAVWATGSWREFLLAWAVPIGPLIAVSAALQFPSEHLWLASRLPGERTSSYMRRISHGRFMLVPAPRRGLGPLSVLAWTLWCLRMVPPLFERFFVCVSILPAHDYHHHAMRIRAWPMEPYLRQKAIEEGDGEWREYYGLAPAYRDQFAIWSALPRSAAPVPFTFAGAIGSVFRGRGAGRDVLPGAAPGKAET
jgi:hypothetical protein